MFLQGEPPLQIVAGFPDESEVHMAQSRTKLGSQNGFDPTAHCRYRSVLAKNPSMPQASALKGGGKSDPATLELDA